MEQHLLRVALILDDEHTRRRRAAVPSQHGDERLARALTVDRIER
jgi:hypothetical protein